MSRNRLMSVLGLLMVMSMVLAACGGGTVATEAPAEVTEAPAVTEAPTEPPTPTEPPVTRTGPWIDEIVFSEQADNAVCISQIQAGDVDACADGNTNPADFKTVQGDANLKYATAYGLNFGLLYNPVPTFADGRINPFGNAKIREAMNMAVDRDYVIQEIFGGLGAAKFTTLVGVFPDYARYIDVARAIETKYAYNLEKANEVISAEMEALGATKNADGKWAGADGTPLTIILVIRTEDERLAIGDYVANQLESLGFVVDRQYKSRSEASPIWARSDPNEGQFHIYTEGWINTVISRDDGTNFGFYYTDFGGCCGLGVNFMNPTDGGVTQEFYDVSQKLYNNEFANMDERGELFKQALAMSMENGYHTWIIDTQAFFPTKGDLTVAADLAGGISGSRLYPFTLRIGETEGGSVNLAMNDNFIDPWNPVGGSNWISDTMIQRATTDVASMPDPYTGLSWPQRVENLTVTAKEGLPITKTLDWVNLEFQAGDIAVPADAWSDWDAATQTFIPAGEGKTALVKVTWTYPADLYDTVAWHDGSSLSAADFVMGMIMTFDPGKEGAGLYDEAYVPSLEAFMATFKGVQIESTNPLVISTYTDSYQLDAENFGYSWWPNYSYGGAAWHNLTPAILAEQAGEIAFTIDKATALTVEWTNFIDGPTLEVQKKYLDEALANSTIPFSATLGQFVTADEAKVRYENLSAWYTDHGHFILGTGPFYLDQVFTTEGNAVLKRNENHPDLANKWDRFSEPMIALADLSGDGQVVVGQEANFDVTVTYNEAPYPADQIDGVKYLVFNSNGDLVASGDAEFVADGQYKVTLPADVTSKFEAGSNKIEVAVVSRAVSIPSFASFEFVTVK